ncbi:MAG: hypothetical protein RBR45_14210 [Pseudomonas sp.]|nr:hypothetical protein [Pseudomonas sp.]
MRKSMLKFTARMENMLCDYDEEKGQTGWITDVGNLQYLMEKFINKVSCIEEAYKDCDRTKIQNQCVHCANYLMMIADYIQVRYEHEVK